MSELEKVASAIETSAQTDEGTDHWCVYVTYHPLFGYYYVGKTYTRAVTEQFYQGSGYGITDELESERGPEYVTEILATFKTEQQAYDAEREVLGTRWRTDRMCINRCPGGGKALSAEQRYKRAGKPSVHQVKAEQRRQQKQAQRELASSVQRWRHHG